MITNVVVCVIAGLGAGLATGFAGLSAAVVICPLLIVFLGFDSYTAVCVALASDVLASFFSALIYKKNGNIDVRSGLIMLVSTIVFTVFGSYVGSLAVKSYVGIMNTVSLLMPLFIGASFILNPRTKKTLLNEERPKWKKTLYSLLGGMLIGTVCGFSGCGGGMMLLIFLTYILGYDLKTAVGTSVFIMGFVALTGMVSRFSFGIVYYPYFWLIFAMCALFSLIGAIIASSLANRMNPRKLNIMTGLFIYFMGLLIIAVNS